MGLLADDIRVVGVGKALDIMEVTDSSPPRLKPNRPYCCQGIQQRHASPPPQMWQNKALCMPLLQ